MCREKKSGVSRVLGVDGQKEIWAVPVVEISLLCLCFHEFLNCVSGGRGDKVQTNASEGLYKLITVT